MDGTVTGGGHIRSASNWVGEKLKNNKNDAYSPEFQYRYLIMRVLPLCFSRIISDALNA